ILFLHETFSFQKIAAIVMVFAGTILLGADLKALAKGFRVKLFEGVGAALFSALSASLGFFFVAIVSRQGNWFYTTIGIRVTISFFTFLLLIYKKQTVKKMFTDIPWRFVIPAAFLDVAAFALYTFASSKFEVSYIAAFVSSQSLVGVLLAHIILKEKLEKYQYIGLPLIIGGLVLLNLFV
ncbi:MAG TPA: EamA family transporter, partial [Candidatus Saccharimonadales bacterium]|nr:EamA family transporter [Candidatus Saccharimonadales bacterium]